MKFKNVKEIEDKYGEMYRANRDNGTVRDFNTQTAAYCYALENNIIYEHIDKVFYCYKNDTGIWSELLQDELIDNISLYIHEIAVDEELPALDQYRKNSVFKEMITYLKTACRQDEFFATQNRIFIHCRNTMLVWNSENKQWDTVDFAPEFYSRHALPIDYNPQAEAMRFKNELLKPLLLDDDIGLLQQYCGQCLIGRNITQSILLMIGSGGSGKGTLANIVEALVGEDNYTQIRPEQMLNRFESSFFRGKTLLSGKESNTSFFSSKGMHTLKSLVGDDKLRVELKNSNRHAMINGTYNVFIVGNTPPMLEFESQDDMSAWQRRLRFIQCCSHKPAAPIPDFAQILLQTEGSGILNWALSGAEIILRSGSSRLPCNEHQRAVLKFLFQSSDPLNYFLTECVEKKHGFYISGEELFCAFTEFMEVMELNTWTQRQFQKNAPEAMLKLFQTPLRRDIKRRSSDGRLTNRSGYANVAFKNKIEWQCMFRMFCM